MHWNDVKVESMFCPNPCSRGAELFYARSNLQEANLKTLVPIVNKAFTACVVTFNKFAVGLISVPVIMRKI